MHPPTAHRSSPIPSPSRYLESFQEPATKVESRRRSTNTRLEDQSVDLGFINVNNEENFCSKLQLKFGKCRTNFKELKNLFDITHILNVSPIDWSGFLMDEIYAQVIKCTKAKVQICSDSVSGRYKIIQEQTKDDLFNSKNFNSPILAEDYFELMEN